MTRLLERYQGNILFIEIISGCVNLVTILSRQCLFTCRYYCQNC